MVAAVYGRRWLGAELEHDDVRTGVFTVAVQIRVSRDIVGGSHAHGWGKWRTFLTVAGD